MNKQRAWWNEKIRADIIFYLFRFLLLFSIDGMASINEVK